MYCGDGGRMKVPISLSRPLNPSQVAADSAMEQITTALSEASLRKGETERLKEDLAVNEKATQSRKGDIEQVDRWNVKIFPSCFTLHRVDMDLVDATIYD